MRKVLLIAAAMLGCLVPVAEAGPATVLPNGDFGAVDFDVAPPVAGADSMTVGYHAFFGNRNGERAPTQSTVIRLPRGTRSNGPFFKQCALPATTQELGSARCPKASRIGGGTFEADARPSVAEPIAGTIEAYNGSPYADKPTIIFIAIAQLGTNTVRTELDLSFSKDKGVPALLEIPPPEGAQSGLYSLTRVDVTMGKTIRQKGIVTGLIVPPRTCSRTWLFEEEVVLANNRGTIVAQDRVPCVRG
jgi:hypothetical protein